MSRGTQQGKPCKKTYNNHMQPNSLAYPNTVKHVITTFHCTLPKRGNLLQKYKRNKYKFSIKSTSTPSSTKTRDQDWLRNTHISRCLHAENVLSINILTDLNIPTIPTNTPRTFSLPSLQTRRVSAQRFRASVRTSSYIIMCTP